MSIARYCEDRFLTLVPVLDVEECVDESQLTIMWPVFQQLISSFPNVRYFVSCCLGITYSSPIFFSLVHIGPRLSSLLLPEQLPNGFVNGDSYQSHSDSFNISKVWHLLSLPASVTLMLCCNNLTATCQLPPNVILMEYGFQVSILSIKDRALAAKLNTICFGHLKEIIICKPKLNGEYHGESGLKSLRPRLWINSYIFKF
jgi:hypothetical protein